MELNEAFDILLETEKPQNALTIIRNNKEESIRILIEKLKYVIEDIEKNSENTTNLNICIVLSLLAELKAKDAFQYLIKVLDLKNQNFCWGANNNIFSCLVNTISKVISDENDILVLKNYIGNSNIENTNQLVACYSIINYYQENNKMNDLEVFNDNIVHRFNKNEFDYYTYHDLLLVILESSISNHLTNVVKDLYTLLIKLIIECQSGYNYSGFKDYFKYLYKIDPLIPGRINNVKECIGKLCNCIDNDLFKQDDLIGVGKFLFSKVLDSVDAVTPEIIKMAIKQINHYPYNDRTIPYTDDQYYEEICGYLGITKIPKENYRLAKRRYKSIFEEDYLKLKQKIEALIKETKKQIERIDKETNMIIANSNKDQSVKKNIQKDVSQIVKNHFKQKELTALYKDDNSNKSGLLVFYLNEITNFFESFCEDINNQEKIDEILKQISIKCASAGSTYEIDIEDVFMPYTRAIEQFNYLLAETPHLTLYNIFYRVKFLPFVEKIQGEFRLGDSTKNKDTCICLINEKIDNHPLNPKSLSECYRSNTLNYCTRLEEYKEEIISDIKQIISNSICLKKRKDIIEYCLLQIKIKNYEIAINLLPVQIEGLFADLLEYSTVLEYINDIKQYKTILNLELVKKIGFGIDKNINISFETIAYFKYYFNSIVRNTVAHGNYDLLLKNRSMDMAICKEDDKEKDKKIIALELLLDLNYLVYVISKINEIDTANKYVNSTYESYISALKEKCIDTFYNCVLSDLLGTRNRFNISQYKSGIFVTYEPIQLVYWIFNPYYEQYLNKKNLSTIREVICSSEFWGYVKERLDNKKFDKEIFQRVVKKMFAVNEEDEVKSILGEINKKLKEMD